LINGRPETRTEVGRGLVDLQKINKNKDLLGTYPITTP